MIVRWLSDAYQMTHHPYVNSNQTSVRQVSHTHQTYTIHLTDIWWMSGICLVHLWCTYGTVYVWWAYSTCLVYMWYLSDRCLVGVDRCLVGHLTVIWQLSGDHLTRSNRQIAPVWWKRWSTKWQVRLNSEYVSAFYTIKGKYMLLYNTWLESRLPTPYVTKYELPTHLVETESKIPYLHVVSFCRFSAWRIASSRHRWRHLDIWHTGRNCKVLCWISIYWRQISQSCIEKFTRSWGTILPLIKKFTSPVSRVIVCYHFQSLYVNIPYGLTASL